MFKAKHVMKSGVLSVSPDDVCSVDEDTNWVTIGDIFKSGHMRSLPVTRNGKLVGVITRHDLICVMQEARKRVPEATRGGDSP